MNQHDDDSNGANDRTLNRRALIKKALAVGSVGYVAPMILGSATPASAQAISGLNCTNTGCIEEVNSCAAGFCACVSTTTGPHCVDPFCSDVSCTSTADCPSGWFCFTQGCCSIEDGPGNFCIPPCGTIAPGFAMTEARTTAWWQ